MIFYRNSAGKEVHFDEPPFSVDITELAGFNLAYNANAYTNRYGGSISKYTIGIIERNIVVGICAKKEKMEHALDELLAITQYDVQKSVPGRFYVGDTYILCNIAGSAMRTFFDPDIEFAEKTYRLVISYPYWCREITSEYLPSDREVLYAEHLDYPYDIPYEYLYDGNAGRLLENNHFADSDFKMTIYGPVSSPRVTISGHIYEVNADLYESEYIIIDSRMSQVYKTTRSGEQINLFNYRNKKYDLFKRIPVGSNTIVFEQNFGFSITLFQERSELGWNIS